MNEYAVLPFNKKKISGKNFICTRFGTWSLLDKEELKKVLRFDIDEKLLSKLKKDLIAVDENNFKELFSVILSQNRSILTSPSLHIVVLTSKCNYKCVYCHANKTIEERKDLSKEDAIKILNYIFKGSNNHIAVEMQGGESTLNWDVVVFLVEQLKKLNEIEKRDLRIALVSNLSLLDKEKMKFLVKNNVSVCTSLDGPKELHNKNRTLCSGEGTYEKTVSKIKEIREIQKNMGASSSVNALMTTTKESLKFPKEIIDEYVNLGIKQIHIRPLTYLGAAKENWKGIGYSAEEFLGFWKKCVDYIIELNKKGIKIKEKMASIILSRLLFKTDPLYTEMMNPCGAGRCQVLYSEDGSIYTCDEARSLGNDLFKLGMVEDEYGNVMGGEKMFAVCQSSMLDLYDPLSPYSAFMGTCPVQNFSIHQNIVPRIHQNFVYKISSAQFDYIIEKLDDPKTKEIFINWFN